MAADAAAKPVYMFYHIQGERGESPAHPNACRLTCATPGKVTFGDVLASFPLAGTASFHFRFQVTVDKQVMFLDLSNPDDVVPMFNGSVIAKILRLGELQERRLCDGACNATVLGALQCAYSCHAAAANADELSLFPLRRLLALY